MSEAVAPNHLGCASQQHSPGVAEVLGFTAEWFEKPAILFLEVFEPRLLVSVHAAPDGNQEALEMGCYGKNKPSRTLAAQFSRLPRPSS